MEQKKKKSKWKLILIIGAVIVVIGGLANATSGQSTSSVSSQAQSGSSNVETQAGDVKSETVKEKSKVIEERVYSIGEKVTIPDECEIVVNKVGLARKVGNEYLNSEASDGAVYVAVQYSVKNLSKKGLNSFSIPTPKLLDPSGTEYDKHSTASTYYELELGIETNFNDLNPNLSRKGALIFEVSKDIYLDGKGFKLRISKGFKDYDYTIN